MKKLSILLASICLLAIQIQAQEAIYFADHPTLSPDGSTVVFSYEGDLWAANTDKNTIATRLTAMDGDENNPIISPDGKWLVFSSNQFGNNDLYVMPTTGGTIRQLTNHQASDVPSSWSWDNQTIYFVSSRYNRMTTFSISLKGGTPKRLFGHYHNIMHNVAAAPNGDLYFNESWESSMFTHRKRYKGAYNPDIKSYNPTTKKYTQHTTYNGKDLWATVDKNGKVYFASDEANGEYNLYTFDNGKKKQLTKFDEAIHHPMVNANGNMVAFRKGYQIWIYDTKTEKSRQLKISAPKNVTIARTQDFNVKGNISYFDVSADGKKMAFVSRGELFVSDMKGKFVKQIATAADGRVSEVVWMKDNKTLLFSQTVNGWQNWFSVAANGKGQTKQHTKDVANNRNLTLNSDRTKAVYLSGRNELRLMDLATMESTVVVKDEFWAMYSDVPYFSPDDAYVVFSVIRNFEKDVLLHHFATKKTTNLTQTGVTETSPYWSPDGKYLYFLSNRTQPSYPYGLENARMYKMPLQKWDAPYRSSEFDKLFKEEEKEDKKKDKKEKEKSEDKKKEEKPKKVVEIDFENPMSRIQRFGPNFGTQGRPVVFQKGDKTTVLFTSNHDEGRYNIYTRTSSPFEKTKTEKIKGGNAGGFGYSSAKGKHYLLFRGNIHELKGSKANKISISHKFRRQLKTEFEQMYYETWANMGENFYNKSFHGIDWKKMRDQYASYLPKINSRDNLRRVLNDLLGELNTSHFGFYSNGKEERIYYGTTTMATGIDFDNENPFKVAGIIKNTPVDRKGININIGDELIAINGENIDKTRNRESYFAQPSMDKEMSLTFKGTAEEYTIKIHPTFYGSIKNSRYNAWMANCQKRVDEQSNNRIAYVHMKNMGGGELQHFKEEMVSEGYQKEALILDLRYNTGGNVHDEVLQFLSQRPYLNWKYREGAKATQPNFAPSGKPIVLLINEQSLSDAEMTSAGFKALGLGKIIGVETYRWIIFTSGAGLVDGSFYRLPAWGCYTLDGQNLEQTGVAPDIELNNTFVDRIEGNDPQLDKAIEEILKQLK